MRQESEPVLIRCSERLYGALLIFYPAEFRQEYGAMMRQVFRDVCRERFRSAGASGVLLWWARTLTDFILSVVEQRRKVDFSMFKSRFIQISGYLMALGGAFSAAAAFSQLQPDDHYTYYGIFQVLMWLLAPGYLLTGVACIGIGVRYGNAFGKLGQGILNLLAVSFWLMAVGIIATAINDNLWNLWLISAILHIVAITAFGLFHARKPVLPIFRWLPLQLALGWLVVLSGILRTSFVTTNNLLSFLFFVGMGLGWLAIGLAVNRQKSPAQFAVV